MVQVPIMNIENEERVQLVTLMEDIQTVCIPICTRTCRYQVFFSLWEAVDFCSLHF